jgi:hypothetical protein
MALYRDMSMDDYLAIDAVSSSMISDVDEHCVAYARWRRAQPRERDRTFTTQARGTALHAAVLEPQKFKLAYIPTLGCEAVLKSGKRAGSVCGASSGRLVRNPDGSCLMLCGTHDDGSLPDDDRIGLSPDSATEVDGMVDAVKRAAGPVIEKALYRELTMTWTDDETGLLMKARPDLISSHTVYDIKALLDIAPQRWGQTMLNNGMHFQAVHYLAGAKANGLDVDSFAWIAVRNTPPYMAMVQPPMDEASLDAAETLWRDRLQQIKDGDNDAGYDAPPHSSLPTWFTNTFSVAT